MRAPDYEGNFTTGLFSRYYEIGKGYWVIAITGGVEYEPDSSRQWSVTIGEGKVNEGGEVFRYDAIHWNCDSASHARCREMFSDMTTPELLEFTEGVQRVDELEYWVVRESNFDQLISQIYWMIGK